jgi:hypothetical protein
MPVDAAPDADLRDAMGPPLDDAGGLAFGPGLVLDQVHLAENDHAWAPYAPLVNVELEQAISSGAMIVLVELRGLDDPYGQDDPDGLALGLYSGEDLDGNTLDNFSGAEDLRVAADSLDPIGNPRALLPAATLSDGALAGSDPGPLALFFPTLGFELYVYDADFAGTLTPGPIGTMRVDALMNGSLDGQLLARDIAVPNPIMTVCSGETLLDVIASGCLALDGINPDVDRDGDGLETFADKDGDYTIDSCYDGNGVEYTSVPGVPCVLDPAFADAYTVRLEVSGVRAILVAPQL